MSVTGAALVGRLRRIGAAGSVGDVLHGWRNHVRRPAVLATVLASALWLGLVVAVGPMIGAARTQSVAGDGSRDVARAVATDLRERLAPLRTLAESLAQSLSPLLAADPLSPDAAARVAALAAASGSGQVAVFDRAGRALTPSAPPLAAVAGAAVQRAASGAGEGFFADAGDIVAVRLVRDAGGDFLGVVVAGFSPGWLDRLAAGLVPDAMSGMALSLPSGRQLFMAGTVPAEPDGPAAATAAVFPGELDIRIVRDSPDEPIDAGRTAALWLALSLPGAALLWVAVTLLRRRLAAVDQIAQRRQRRLVELAGASERLSRLRDPLEVAARGEALVRTILDCDDARVMLGRALSEPADDNEGSERQSVNLIATNGDRLGRITVRRSADRPFTSEEELALDQVARAVAAALESANLLADAMNAKSEVEMILSTISDGVFMLDRRWRVRYVNAAALRYLQRNREEMLGATIWTLFPGLREADVGERFEFAIRTAQDVDFATDYAPLNARYEMRCYPFASGLTVYFRDVTAQRETEEKLRQSQKLEALGQLTGGIAHDVNNLLTVILGNFEMLAMSAEDRQESGAPDLEMAEAGLRAGESASQLMHRLLAFSRRQPLSPRVVAIGDMLDLLEPLLRRTLGEQVVMRSVWQDGLWSSLVDPVELENAILNLAINARDAMPAGGRLVIEASNVQIDRVYATVAGLERTGDFIMLSVADTGTGMSRDVAVKAFDPFFTTKQPGKGTGLGLSMVYGFAKQSGGHVMIDSEPGQGTIIRLYLPRAMGEAHAAGGPEERQVAGGSESILLVEDNDLVRLHTESMLVGLGYAVIAAADGPEALMLLQEGLRPSLLLTDVVLPGGMTGRDVADAAAALVPALRVLFTSGYSGNVLLENGRMTPGVELIGKPFRRAELAVRIREQFSRPPWAALRSAAGAG